jgi:nucleoside-diphosphate-sugar epimerase
MKNILVTGASGQLGSELVPALRDIYGDGNVVASDINTPDPATTGAGPFILLDCLDAAAVAAAAREHHIDTIYHLAALLSAAAERAPQRAYDINIRTLMNVLEVSRERRCALFTPSSIGAFGPGTPRDPAPQDTLQRPTTMYGITKVAGEMLCDYYARRFGVDARGVRYPGLISYVTPPGGGTTDYAVDIFYHALEDGQYTCFLSADTQLDMMYMPDAVRAAMELMEADPARLAHRNAFNVTAMQLTPALLAALIQEHIPRVRISYDVDPVRQGIADSWPRRLDDSAAREEWEWAPRYDARAMTADMIEQLSARIGRKT